MPAARRAKIRQFIEDNFLFREDVAAIGDADSLLDAGLIDSTGVLELVAFIEQEFGVAVADRDIVPDNLDSIERIDAYVARHRSAAIAA
jgi:acyl carrier protein